MERASRVLGKLLFPKESVVPDDLARAAWKAAVGKRIAEHARADRLVRKKLIVGVDDAIWQRQLFSMSRMVLDRVQATLGSTLVEEIEFRISPPRREPQRETRGVPKAAPLFDEADGIEDPGLRRVYRAARKKEMA